MKKVEFNFHSLHLHFEWSSSIDKKADKSEKERHLILVPTNWFEKLLTTVCQGILAP